MLLILFSYPQTWNAFWNDTGLDGLKTLSKIKYNIKNENENENIFMINVDTFESMNSPPKKMTNGVPPVNFGKPSRVYSKAKQHFRSMGGLFRKR